MKRSILAYGSGKNWLDVVYLALMHDYQALFLNWIKGTQENAAELPNERILFLDDLILQLKND